MGKDRLIFVNTSPFLDAFFADFVNRTDFITIFAAKSRFKTEKDMKRILSLAVACLTFLCCLAAVDPHYGVGSVPVVNGRVLFEKTVVVKDASSEQIFDKAMRWAESRFAKPNVIASKYAEIDSVNHHFVVNAEEYIVFKNTFLELDRTRINYWYEITCNDGSFTVRMTRITYWYEENRDGGERFTAEEWITDEQCFNKKKTRLLRRTGKFRIKTIDLFDSLVRQLQDKF